MTTITDPILILITLVWVKGSFRSAVQNAVKKVALFHMQEKIPSTTYNSIIVNYDSRVVPDLKIPHIMTLEL